MLNQKDFYLKISKIFRKTNDFHLQFYCSLRRGIMPLYPFSIASCNGVIQLKI